jgi:hypothetical protein
MRKLVKLTPEEKAEQKRAIEKEKNEHEAATMQRYRKLFPSESNEYA